MATAATLEILIRARDQASRTLGRVQGATQKLGGALLNMAKVAAVAGAAAIVGLGVAAIKMGSDFETAFAEVTTLFDAPKAQIDSLRSGVLDLSSAMGLNAVETTEALYQAISAGVEPAKALAFIEQNAKLAIGGVSDLSTAVDLTTTVINAFGLSLEDTGRVSDVLFTGVRLGKTTIDELGASISQVAPIAGAMGVSIEEVTAGLALMTSQGIKTAEASTGMRQVLAELGKEGQQAAQTFEDIAGQSFPDFIKGGGTVVNAIAMLQKAADDNNLSMIDMFSSIEAGKAATALAVNGTKDFQLALMETLNAAGATDKAFEKMNATFGRQVAILKSKVQVALIRVGVAVLPTVTKAVEKLSIVFSAAMDWLERKGIPLAQDFGRELKDRLVPVVERLRREYEGIQPQLEFVGDLFVRVGRFMADQRGKAEAVGRTIGNVTKFLDEHREILAAVAIAIGVVLIPGIVAWTVATIANTVAHIALAAATLLAYAPILLLIAGIALLVLGIILLVKHWDEVTAFIVEKALWLRDMVVGALESFGNFIKNNWPKILLAILAPWLALTLLIIGNWDRIWATIKRAAAAGWAVVVRLFNAGKDKLIEALQAALGWLADHWKEALLIALTGPLGLAIVFFKRFKGDIVSVLQTLATEALEFGKQIPEMIWEGMKSLKGWLLGKAGEFVKGLIDLLNPANWSFSPENMAQIYEKVGRGAGLAMMEGLRVLESAPRVGVQLASPARLAAGGIGASPTIISINMGPVNLSGSATQQDADDLIDMVERGLRSRTQRGR